MDKVRAAVLGAAGYGGIELLRLLRSHPYVEVVLTAGHSSAGKPLDEVYGHLSGLDDRAIYDTDIERACEAADVIFLAMPHGVGMEMVRVAVKAGRQVIDFSADFRLKDRAVYEEYYVPHKAPELLETAVYGLPELHREELVGAKLIAVPGCYPTGAILALAPAVREGLLEPLSIIVDSKSGVSGAGRSKLDLTTHFAEVNESVSAYSVAKHRHTPEIDQELSALGEQVRVTFVPHLIPMSRGILTTAYGSLRKSLTAGEIHELYCEAYANEPFVHVLPLGKFPATKYATATNHCFVGLTVDERAGRLIVVSAIDNLGKGLSGAAVQCLNVSRGWPETTALEAVAPWP
ncbi:MAG: N-acetyl-gamma-glutamyl-phosphate reductase [Armatimonadetes bacterium]|nr:N-acetyl-gamma-glutamyl-phosphate reductase [Armatimonadota bacterium]